MLAPYETIAMQYSPRNAIMYVSMLDAGTMEVLREMGKTIVSSADLVSRFEAVLTKRRSPATTRHRRRLTRSWRRVSARSGDGFVPPAARPARSRNMTSCSGCRRQCGAPTWSWENGPNVSVNANSADSHYEPTEASAKEIQDGDFVLIDIWARKNRPGTCYYDITWTGVVGREPSRRRSRSST